jgi:hypothetical protein
LDFSLKEAGFELVHAGVYEHERWVVLRHNGRGAHEQVLFALNKKIHSGRLFYVTHFHLLFIFEIFAAEVSIIIL